MLAFRVLPVLAAFLCNFSAVRSLPVGGYNTESSRGTSSSSGLSINQAQYDAKIYPAESVPGQSYKTSLGRAERRYELNDDRIHVLADHGATTHHWSFQPPAFWRPSSLEPRVSTAGPDPVHSQTTQAGPSIGQGSVQVSTQTQNPEPMPITRRIQYEGLHSVPNRFRDPTLELWRPQEAFSARPSSFSHPSILTHQREPSYDHDTRRSEDSSRTTSNDASQGHLPWQDRLDLQAQPSRQMQGYNIDQVRYSLHDWQTRTALQRQSVEHGQDTPRGRSSPSVGQAIESETRIWPHQHSDSFQELARALGYPYAQTPPQTPVSQTQTPQIRASHLLMQEEPHRQEHQTQHQTHVPRAQALQRQAQDLTVSGRPEWNGVSSSLRLSAWEPDEKILEDAPLAHAPHSATDSVIPPGVSFELRPRKRPSATPQRPASTLPSSFDAGEKVVHVDPNWEPPVDLTELQRRLRRTHFPEQYAYLLQPKDGPTAKFYYALDRFHRTSSKGRVRLVKDPIVLDHMSLLRLSGQRLEGARGLWHKMNFRWLFAESMEYAYGVIDAQLLRGYFPDLDPRDKALLPDGSVAIVQVKKSGPRGYSYRLWSVLDPRSWPRLYRSLGMP